MVRRPIFIHPERSVSAKHTATGQTRLWPEMSRLFDFFDLVSGPVGLLSGSFDSSHSGQRTGMHAQKDIHQEEIESPSIPRPYKWKGIMLTTTPLVCAWLRLFCYTYIVTNVQRPLLCSSLPIT